MPVRPEAEYTAEVLGNRKFATEPIVKKKVDGAEVGPSTAAFGESFLGKMTLAGYDRFFGEQYAPQDGYDPFDEIINDNLSGWADYLGDARSPEEYAHRRGNVMQSVENEKVISEAGFQGAAYTMMWGGADPINFIPIIGVAAKTAKATKSLSVAAAAAAGMGAGAQAIQETVVSAVDPNYHIGEGITSIGAMGVLSGIIGPYAAKSLDPEVRRALVSQSSLTPVQTYAPGQFGDGTAGAARVVGEMSGENLKPITSLGIGRATAFIGPSTRLQNSVSEAVRKYNAILHDTPLINEGNIKGIASSMPIEVERKLYMAMESDARKKTMDAYYNYRVAMTGKKGVGIVNDIKDVTGYSARSGVLPRAEFYERVGKAMRRGDKAPFEDFTEANPFIEQAAKANRDMSDQILNEMLEAGLFKDEPDLKGTAESWFRRIYDRDTIASKPDAFEYGITQFYKETRDADVIRLPILEQELAAAKKAAGQLDMKADKTAAKEATKRISDLEEQIGKIKARGTFIDEELASIARTTKERIMGNPMGLLDYEDAVEGARAGTTSGKMGVRGTKERKLTIPDTYKWEYGGETYTFEDFLISDPTRMQASVSRSVVPDLLMYRRFGTLDTQHIMQAVTDDYGRLIAKAKTASEKAKLQRAKTNDLQDLKDSIAILRGTFAKRDDYYSAVPTAMRMAKQANFARLMGLMGISSIPDAGSLVMQYGVRKVAGNFLHAFVKGARAEVMNMALEDAQKFMIGTESVMNDQFIKMYDADIFMPVSNKVEAGLNYVSGGVQKLSLMNVWMDSVRPLAAILEQDRIVGIARKLASGKKLSKLEIGETAAKYLDKNDLKIIADQFEKYGQTQKGALGGELFIPNTKTWDVADDAVATTMRKFRAAVAKEVDTVIIKPGMENPKSIKAGGVASLIFQFKGYMFSATNRLLTRSAQRLALGDKRLVMGITTMVGLGSLSYALKAKLAGKDISENPTDWLVEGIDRSGVLAAFGELNNITEKLSYNKIGIRPLIGASPATRYIQRNALETLLGPTAGAVQDTSELFGSMAQHGDWTQGEVQKLRRLIPLQNTLGVRHIFDAISEQISDTLDLPERR